MENEYFNAVWAVEERHTKNNQQSFSQKRPFRNIENIQDSIILEKNIGRPNKMIKPNQTFHVPKTTRMGRPGKSSSKTSHEDILKAQLEQYEKQKRARMGSCDMLPISSMSPAPELMTNMQEPPSNGMPEMDEVQKNILAHITTAENLTFNDIYPTYFDQHENLRSQMRTVLIDWIVDVHYKFHMYTETLYLSVNLVDRFLSTCEQVHRSKLQLIGAVCLFIATKYVENVAPRMKDFVHLSCNSFTKQDMERMEMVILKTLDYKLMVPTMYDFIKVYLTLAQCSKREQLLCGYLAESATTSYRLLAYRPSEIAAACTYLARYMARYGTLQSVWTPALKALTGKEEAHLRPLVREMIIIMLEQQRSKYKAVANKYAKPGRMEVSTMMTRYIPHLYYQFFGKRLSTSNRESKTQYHRPSHASTTSVVHAS